MFKIDSHIPVPADAGTGRRSTYPLADMNVGDSFLVPFNGDTAKKVTQRLHSAVSQFQRRATNSDRRFTVRAEASGVRVWRIA